LLRYEARPPDVNGIERSDISWSKFVRSSCQVYDAFHGPQSRLPRCWVCRQLQKFNLSTRWKRRIGWPSNRSNYLHAAG
jgi:hypothetical protein